MSTLEKTDRQKRIDELEEYILNIKRTAEGACCDQCWQAVIEDIIELCNETCIDLPNKK